MSVTLAYSISAQNGTQLAKLSFNHAIGRTHS